MSQRWLRPGGGCTAASAALDARSVSSLSFRVQPWSSLPDAAGAAFAGVSSHPTLRTPGLTQFPLFVLTPQVLGTQLPSLPPFLPTSHSPTALVEKGRFQRWEGCRAGAGSGTCRVCQAACGRARERTSRQGSLRGVRGRTRPPWDLSLCLRCPSRSERNAGCCLEEAPSPRPSLPLIQTPHSSRAGQEVN